jgi:hypothetical protein
MCESHRIPDMRHSMLTILDSTIVVQDRDSSSELGRGAGIVCPVIASSPEIDYPHVTANGFRCKFSPPSSSSVFANTTSSSTAFGNTMSSVAPPAATATSAGMQTFVGPLAGRVHAQPAIYLHRS